MTAQGLSASRLVGGLWGLFLAMGGLMLPSAHAAATLPNGASSVQESYQDWRLACHIPDSAGQKNSQKNGQQNGQKAGGETEGQTGVKCLLSQQAVDVQSHRRVLSVRVEVDGDQIRGMAVVPFGLDLIHGLTLTNAAQPVGDTYSFSTCLPTGCLVPLSFDDRQWHNLLSQDTATLTAMSLSGLPMPLIFSTRGLAKAVERARSLMQ